MMKYEARWYEDDSGANADSPDEVDFYFHDKSNHLYKAIYNAEDIDLSSLNWTHIEENNLAHTDRVYYSRRRVPTRDKVNWYRGSEGTFGTAVGSLPDTTTAATQTTTYETSDDPTKDEDTPATVGNGSRHNNTVVGQVPYSYDNNRNLLSEGVLEYEYDYRDVLCTVKRLSDGATVITHQNDAFGYRVASHVTWELGRRAHFDTRFELDVDMDSDGNSTAMGYVDGGLAANIVEVVNEAAWTSRLDLMPTEDQYHDFLVNVPTVVGEYSDPFGYVALDHNRALWIFKGEYRFADITDPSLNIVASVSATTAGQHIIGFDPGNSKIFLDGSLLMNVSNPKGLRILARFGSQGLNPGGLLDEGAEGDLGLELLEYQSYMPTFSRNEVDPTPAPGGLDLQTVPGPFFAPALPNRWPWWPPYPGGPWGDDGDGGDGSGNFYMMEVDSDGDEVIQNVPLVDSLSWDVTNFGTIQTCFALENARGGAAGIVSDGVAESGSEGTFETIGLIQYVAFDASGATTVYKPAETVTGLLDEDLGSILHNDQGTSTSVGTNARVSNAQGYNFVIKTPGIADWIGDISDEEIKKIMDDWDGPILPEQKPMPLGIGDWFEDGFRGKDAYKKLTRKERKELKKADDNGWSLMSGGIDCEFDEDIEIDSDVNAADFRAMQAKGRDIQWIDDKIAIDWTSKRVYIDACYDSTGAELFRLFLKALERGNLFEDTALDTALSGYAAIAAEEQARQTGDASWREWLGSDQGKRAASQAYQDGLSFSSIKKLGTDSSGITFGALSIAGAMMMPYRIARYGTLFKASKGSSAIEKVLKSDDLIGATGKIWKISNKHLFGANGGYRKFKEGLDSAGISKLVKKALAMDSKTFHQSGTGRRINVIISFKKPIGSRGETNLKVVITKSGEVITAYPVR